MGLRPNRKVKFDVEPVGAGGVMGTSGAHNPTFTAQTLAWRTAEYLTANWKAIAGG